MEWQRKCESRMAGRLVHSEFTISTSSSEMTTESERKKIEADLNILLAKVEGGTEGSKSQTLKREKERTWKVNVEFYPLSDYEPKVPQNVESKTDNIVSMQIQSNPIQQKNYLLFGLIAIIIILIGIIIAIIL